MLGATYGNKQIRDLLFVLLPCSAILPPALLRIANGSVKNHGGKECGVEPREGTLKAGDEAPCKGLAEHESV